MTKIQDVKGRQVLDSRGNPTIEVDVILSDGTLGRAIVPSGASTGEHEAFELRDGDDKTYLGKGVLKAVNNVNTEIAETIRGIDPFKHDEIDKKLIDLDGTPNKNRLGANAILGVSMATARAAARSARIPLYRYLAGLAGNNEMIMPLPMCNILNGGAHSDAPVDIQEFMVAPVGASSFSVGLQMVTEVFHTLKKILKRRNLSVSVGDEGGFAPAVESADDGLECIIHAVESAGYTPGKDIKLALDAAAAEFYDSDKKCYVFKKSSGRTLSSSEMVDYYRDLSEKYPIYSIEDGLDENDWDGWKIMTDAMSSSVQLVGDDLFVTNIDRLKRGIDTGVANAILIKLNQIGTLTETLDAIRMAKGFGFGVVISHRSGETEDTFIADLAVGAGAGQIKTGSLSRTDRTAKYNQLLRIEEELGDEGVWKKGAF